MRVGFYHAGESPYLARRLVQSVRQVMPSAPIVHFSDPASVETVAMNLGQTFVHPFGPIALRCLEAFASVRGDWLFVDTDVEIRSDVRHVFDDPDSDFDVAVATREGTLLDKEIGTKFMARAPFNKGVIFSRSQAFWQACVDHILTLSEKRQQWMGDQDAVNHVIASGKFHVKVLPNAYNYPPKSKTDDVSGKHILHFKGMRKQWALDGVFA